MKFNILDKQGEVINTIVASLEFVEATYAYFKEVPEQTVTTETSRTITRFQFLSLFTEAELVAVYTAAKQSVLLEVYLAKLNATSEVDLNSTETITGVRKLEEIGLINQGRAVEILN